MLQGMGLVLGVEYCLILLQSNFSGLSADFQDVGCRSRALEGRS